MTSENVRDDREYWTDESEYNKALDGKYFRLELIEQIDRESLKLKYLLEQGLKAAPQKSKKLYGNLLLYIESNFNNMDNEDFFPESTDYEGLKKQVTVNKYERSSIARAKCIEFHGCNCEVCKTNFEEKYGEVGKDFIHVHHVLPLAEVNEEYKINFRDDLIPVCPNCHAMLHRKIDGKLLSIDELKNCLK